MCQPVNNPEGCSIMWFCLYSFLWRHLIKKDIRLLLKLYYTFGYRQNLMVFLEIYSQMRNPESFVLDSVKFINIIINYLWHRSSDFAASEIGSRAEIGPYFGVIKSRLFGPRVGILVPIETCLNNRCMTYVVISGSYNIFHKFIICRKSLNFRFEEMVIYVNGIFTLLGISLFKEWSLHWSRFVTVQGYQITTGLLVLGFYYLGLIKGFLDFYVFLFLIAAFVYLIRTRTRLN